MRANSLTLRILVGALVLVASSSAWADDASHRAAAVDLMEVMHVEKTTNDAIDVMLKAQMEMNPILRPYEDLMRAFLAKYMSWESLREKYTDIYVEAYSEEELKAVSEFYRSPVGQKVLASLPRVMERAVAVGQSAVTSHLDELRARVKERAEAAESAKQSP